MAVLDTLRRQKDFTSTEQALADYVLEHPDEVAEMSIASLSAATHTSNAAVVRFCKRLGIDGYRSFRIELARELEHVRAAQGCKIIAVTADDTLSERLPMLDCLLLLPMGENRSKRVATYYSQACIRYALNCVYGEIFSRN